MYLVDMSIPILTHEDCLRRRIGRTLWGMWSQRSVIDYSLQRRATLRSLFSGGVTMMDDVCDADPYLLRAAKFHGEQTNKRCPICRNHQLLHVTYVFSDELGQYSGRIRATAELEGLAQRYGELRVFVVEVCQGCAWNHLTTSYVLGDGVPRRPPRRQRTVEDEYP